VRPRTGLRLRLLIALVVTSVLTLAAAAVVLLNPLQERLREQSLDGLRVAALSARPEIQDALRNRRDDPAALQARANRLRTRADARVLIIDDRGELLYDTEFVPPVDSPNGPRSVALRALINQETDTRIAGDEASVAVRLFPRRRPTAVLVARKQLTDVADTVDQVQTAFVAAAAVGLIVAFALAVALSTTLSRRLGKLREVALRITAEGPGAATPLDETRDEVGDLARALARMQEELARQEAARRSFVATASHELRTPLTMLQGTMELLEEDLADGRLDVGDAQAQVASARRELRRLSTLAAELLDLSRLDAAVPLRSEAVELGELARAVVAEFALRAEERGAVLEAERPAGPCWALGDPDAIARVARILIDNALRYGPSGGMVRITARADARAATMTVADHGPGIPPEEADLIFERFHRGVAPPGEGGFGLGLAIGRELAERMGGTLRLAGVGPPGAVFVLALPRPARPATLPEEDRGPDRVGVRGER